MVSRCLIRRGTRWDPQPSINHRRNLLSREIQDGWPFFTLFLLLSFFLLETIAIFQAFSIDAVREARRGSVLMLSLFSFPIFPISDNNIEFHTSKKARKKSCRNPTKNAGLWWIVAGGFHLLYSERRTEFDGNSRRNGLTSCSFITGRRRRRLEMSTRPSLWLLSLPPHPFHPTSAPFPARHPLHLLPIEKNNDKKEIKIPNATSSSS